MDIPKAPPFQYPADRARITREPDELGEWTPQFPDMLGHRQFGGGEVPEDFTWPSNPKEWQEELSNTELRREAEASGALGPGGDVPVLVPAAVLATLPTGSSPKKD